MLAVPSFALAQSARPRLAWLSLVSRNARASGLEPFLQGMATLGYQDGRNFDLDERWGENSREVLERLVLEAMQRRPALLVSQGPAIEVVRKHAGKTPVVFGTSGDPIELGIAKSLARPGGNFTGVTFLSYALVGKRVELLHEVAPKATRLAVLSNPEHGGDAKELAATREAAASLGLQVSHHPVKNAVELHRAFTAIAAQRGDGMVVHPDALMVEQRAAIARFALEQRIPGISGWAVLAESGSLLTYGPNLQECYRRLAYFADRILRGAKPDELPIELPGTVELVVNLKTAKALGITVPPALLLRADRVIV
ncbi:MAG TPA: ABC transporter substrate-binding protein [Burkholderiales bacterium]|nr:ABC transporter substrate-binding protein [Burkholderiales bacterium]